MAQESVAVVLHGIKDLRLEKTKTEEPGDHDVLLEIGAVGICGSDIHYYSHGSIGDFVVKKPMIIGHEAAGRVVKKGKLVRNLQIGDRVAIEPGVPCRYCEHCKSGRYNLCQDIVFCATPPCDGNLCRYYKHPADLCFKLPDNMSYEDGALLEPLSVAVHACKRAEVSIGSTISILGAGPIGLAVLLVAKSMGAAKVVIGDAVESRLKIATELGADGVHLISPKMSVEENSQVIYKLFNDFPNTTIDASGAEFLIQMAIKVTKPGGKVVLVGMGPDMHTIPLITAVIKELDIKGHFRYANDYSDALQLIATGKVNMRTFVTHRFKFEDSIEAFKAASTKGFQGLKVMINCLSE